MATPRGFAPPAPPPGDPPGWGGIGLGATSRERAGNRYGELGGVGDTGRQFGGTWGDLESGWGDWEATGRGAGRHWEGLGGGTVGPWWASHSPVLRRAPPEDRWAIECDFRGTAGHFR